MIGDKKQFHWAVGGFLLVAGLSAIMGFLQTRSSDERWGSGDQSLDSLDVLPMADQSGISAPGGPLRKGSRNGDWTNPESMLYQAPPGTQVEGAEGNNDAADKLADDMSRASSMGKKPMDSSGWNGETARTGLSSAMGGAARPTLAPMSGTFGGSSGGASGSSFSSGSAATPFGTGHSHPGEAHIGGMPQAHEAGVPHGGNQSLAALRNVANAMGNARRSADAERSWGHGAGSFDGASAASTLSSGGGADSGVGAGQGVPANLKGDANPQDLSKKDIQPPAPPPPKPVDNSSLMKQQMLMMVAGIIVAGVVGAAVQGLMKGGGSPSDPAAAAAAGAQIGGAAQHDPTQGVINNMNATHTQLGGVAH